MSDPKWISRALIDFIQHTAIEKTGGSHGLRDEGLLDSALARPRNLYAYGETDIFQLAASYAEAISQNHPFIDGNKRAAFGAADTFFYNNGYDLQPNDKHGEVIEALAQGNLTREFVADHFRETVIAI